MKPRERCDVMPEAGKPVAARCECPVGPNSLTTDGTHARMIDQVLLEALDGSRPHRSIAIQKYKTVAAGGTDPKVDSLRET